MLLVGINYKLDRLDPLRKKHGMWHGNDTLWRSILDVNHIVLYCDKNGVMKNSQQRKVITIGDMIVSGEKEGPLRPSYKKVGGILISDNLVEFDLIAVKLMGFDYNKFPVLKEAMKDKLLFNNAYNNVYLKSNSNIFDNRLADVDKNFGFIATSGWNDYLQM